LALPKKTSLKAKFRNISGMHAMSPGYFSSITHMLT